VRPGVRRGRGAVLVAALALVGCTVSPNAGEEAVLITKPIIFGHGGVLPSTVKPGRSWVAPTTHHVIVNMQPQLFRVHFDDFMSRDGVPLDFDASLRLQISDAVKLVRDFGVEPMTLQQTGVAAASSAPRWYVNNVHRNFETLVRQAVRKHGMNETAISTAAIDDIDREVSAALAEYLRAVGLPVRLVDLTVGRANPPDAIKNQRVKTAEEQQRKLTEEQRKLAEDARRAAEVSRAAADNAYREALQLSPEQFIRLETVKMQREVCRTERCTFVVGGAPVATVDVGGKR
jgi:regulator of protease activity HflC (stomatin/prohibitin superfamily)